MTGIHELGVLLVVISKLLVCLSVCLSCLWYLWVDGRECPSDVIGVGMGMCVCILFVGEFMCVEVRA